MARLTKCVWLAGAALAAACAGSSPAGPTPVVTGPVALGLRVVGLPAELSPGDTVQLKAEVFLGGGARKECAASWAVDDPRVVTISPTGLLTAGLTGYATVTVSCAGLSNTAQTRVVAANPYQLVIVAYDSEVLSEFGVAGTHHRAAIKYAR